MMSQGSRMIPPTIRSTAKAIRKKLRIGWRLRTTVRPRVLLTSYTATESGYARDGTSVESFVLQRVRNRARTHPVGTLLADEH